MTKIIKKTTKTTKEIIKTIKKMIKTTKKLTKTTKKLANTTYENERLSKILIKFKEVFFNDYLKLIKN